MTLTIKTLLVITQNWPIEKKLEIKANTTKNIKPYG